MAAATMVDRKIIVFSLNADDAGQSPRGRFPISHYEFISPTPFLALLFSQLFAQAMWSPTRLTRQQSRLERARVAECRYRLRAGFRGALFHQERARSLCAGTNFRNGCLFSTSM